MLSFFLDFVFPKRSLSGKEGEWITKEEWDKLQLTPQRIHAALLQKEGIKYLDCLISAGKYASNPLLQQAIHTLKYKRIAAMHSDLAHILHNATNGLLLTQGTMPILCPVPLHWTRKYHRGFNQAELLARALSILSSWEVRLLLRRSRPTGHQAWRKKHERLIAMQNAFRVVKRASLPPYVILIDDLATTGATLDACAKELKKAGVLRVEALVIARN